MTASRGCSVLGGLVFGGAVSYLTTVGAFVPFHVCEELAQDADEGGHPNVAPLEGTLHAQPGDKPTRVQF